MASAVSVSASCTRERGGREGGREKGREGEREGGREGGRGYDLVMENP